MTLSSYVPVLKIKRGEKAALREVSNDIVNTIEPFLEIVERTKERSLTRHIATAFDRLPESVARYPRCFIDTREIASEGTEAATEVFRRAADERLPFVPVTGLARGVDLPAALEHRRRGVALRLSRLDLETGRLRGLPAFLADSRLQPEEVDLIVDLGDVGELVEEGVSALTEAFLANVPHHLRWRSLIVSACAFPKSMGEVDRGSYQHVERTEWIAWREGLYGRRRKLERLPCFSDCAIQHTSGVEGFDPRLMPVSAAVRYARDDGWLLIKGESTRRSPPSEQFPQLAHRLVYGDLRRWFYGAGHCAGCAGIKAAADGAPRYGAPETWRRLGTVHHLTVAIEALTALPVS